MVTFNELGQPIGDESNELTKFLGTLMRMSQHIGIDYEEWRKVPENKKEDLWSIVTVNCLKILEIMNLCDLCMSNHKSLIVGKVYF